MAAFVPARIRNRRVERALDEEGGESPPRAPGLEGDPAASGERGEPDQSVTDRRAVLALHQRLELATRYRAAIPLSRRQPLPRRGRAFIADDAVVPGSCGNRHLESPPAQRDGAALWPMR